MMNEIESTAMASCESWYTDLEEYIRQGEPGRAERSQAWQTAIGLQAVDGLTTSDYLLDTAKEHIEGAIGIGEVQKRIDSYYEQRSNRKEAEVDTREADVVSARIAELLGEKTFAFKPGELARIHRHLFSGTFPHAGTWRTYNITKKEWVLEGETVLYAAWDSISDTLDYDFAQEDGFSYEGFPSDEFIRHFAKFVSGIWQIHPFCEGNTRTTAVFAIKYLRSLGFKADNDTFAQNSWYFRNALVRANYNDLQNGIHETTRYLELFFRNLLLGEQNELKNRHLHVKWQEDESQSANQSATFNDLKCKNCTLNELMLLREVEADPQITQKALAEKLGKSVRTIKTLTVELQNKGLLQREGAKRNGRWVVIGNSSEAQK